MGRATPLHGAGSSRESTAPTPRRHTRRGGTTRSYYRVEYLERDQAVVDRYTTSPDVALTSGLAEDAIWITPSTRTQGRSAIGEVLRADYSAAPDRCVAPLACVEEGD